MGRNFAEKFVIKRPRTDFSIIEETIVSEDKQRTVDRFLSLLRPLEGDLEAYCRRLIWSEQETPDAIQNAILRAWAAFDRYHDDASFRAWMFRILTNEVFALNRKYGRIAQFEFHLEPEHVDVLPALETDAEYRDWLNAPEALADALDQPLLAALRTLTEVERAVLLMRAIGEFRYKEIAEALHTPLGSVMGNLARARKKMQDAILRSQRRSVL